MTRLTSLLLAVASMVLALTGPAAAQDYPTRPVRVLIPFPPGGINDTVGRLISAQLSERLGKQFIVENRTGAGGIIAGDTLVNAPKDGHMLMIVSMAIAVNPHLYKMNYQATRDFAPISILAKSPALLTASKEFPANSIKELIAMAKAKPGDVKYASSGIGTFMHLGPELFKMMAGVDLLHVPFRGAGPAQIDVIAGNSQLTMASVTSQISHVRSGRLKALGVGGLKRSFVLSNVPTIDEAGVGGYECTNWIGLVAATGTPMWIIEKLNKELVAIQNSPELKKAYENEGAEEVQMTSAEFGTFIASETAKWGKVVQQAGIQPQ